MPRSIYQTGPSQRRPPANPFRGRSGGSSGGGGGNRFRQTWGTGGTEGGHAGFEFDRWQAAQRRGQDASQWAGGTSGVEGRYRTERLGVETRARSDRNRSYRRSRLAGSRSRRNEERRARTAHQHGKSYRDYWGT